MNNSQFVSVLGAVLAVLVGRVAGFLTWITPVEALGLCMLGLSLIGVHTGAHTPAAGASSDATAPFDALQLEGASRGAYNMQPHQCF